MAERDLDRLRSEYARRRDSALDDRLYSAFNKANLFAIHQRQRALLSFLEREGLTSFSNKQILEVGCGKGGVLIEYLNYGADLHSLMGVDLLHDRLEDARQRVPGLRVICANGQSLPFPGAMYDLVLQYTAFSSILNQQIKREMAAEMLRVVKPDGWILWYDFWLNPTNPQTRGIRKAEIRQLFPRCRLSFQQITLAPPIARRLVPVSWTLSMLLEKLRFLNTHYLVGIQPTAL